jgi:hypothetical protein
VPDAALSKPTDSPRSAELTQIVQTVFGVFHHFELARELDRRGYFRRIRLAVSH